MSPLTDLSLRSLIDILCGPILCEQYELLTEERPNFRDFRDSLLVLVVEWSKDGVKAPVAIRDDEKICAHHLKALHKIAVQLSEWSL
jgi:hypothetical protein